MEFIELKNKRTSSMVIEEILSADESREDKIYDLLRNIHERLIRIEAKLLISI
jgi:predicted Zn-ribbon and HTH transcriptional regulator